MAVKDKGVIQQVFTQIDIDNAIKEGYKIAEKQYSENIIELKNKIKELEFKNKLESKWQDKGNQT